MLRLDGLLYLPVVYNCIYLVDVLVIVQTFIQKHVDCQDTLVK